MNVTLRKLQYGFNLVGLLLILVIVGAILYMGLGYMQQQMLYTRIDKMTWQMEQALNAAAAYYIANGTWPANNRIDGSVNSKLQPNYLPPGNYQRSYFGFTSFYTYAANNRSPLYVIAVVNGPRTQADVSALYTVANRLPFGFANTTINPATTPSTAGTACLPNFQCQVNAAINPPGQNLNNATAVNFAGLYHHGACIPAPHCPTDASGTALTASVIVVPVSFSGMNDSTNVYPITSFTAYARGNTPLDTNPPACTNAGGYAASYSTGTSDCTNITNNGPAVTQYWRACVKIITERGDITVTRSDTAWAQKVTIAAFTRCSIGGAGTGEPAGSDFSIYSN